MVHHVIQKDKKNLSEVNFFVNPRFRPEFPLVSVREIGSALVNCPADSHNGGMNQYLKAIVVVGLMGVMGLMVGCHGSTAPQSTTRETLESSADGNETVEINPLAGPTLMRKVAGGYELKNRHIRAVIADDTGNLIYWGRAGIDRNLLMKPGASVQLAGVVAAPMKGYVEKRDDQTWQFIGEDDQHVEWRKIYCLEGNSLLISVLVKNLRDQPLDATIEFQAPFAGVRIAQRGRDVFEAITGFGTIHLQAYNEFPATAPAVPLPVVLMSDPHTLQPQQRISFTTEWKLEE
jgi:hypothetical protein